MNDPYFRKKQRGHIRVGAYAILDRTPTSLHFGDQSLPVGDSPVDINVVAGTYMAGVNHTSFRASGCASKDGDQSFRMNLNYPVRGGFSLKGALDRKPVRRYGFFQAGRLQKDYREEGREQILDHLRSTSGQAEFDKLASAKLQEILVKHVYLVHSLLRTEPMIDVLIHPAIHDCGDEGEKRWIYVDTMREQQAAKAQTQAVALEDSVEAHGGRSELLMADLKSISVPRLGGIRKVDEMTWIRSSADELAWSGFSCASAPMSGDLHGTAQSSETSENLNGSERPYQIDRAHNSTGLVPATVATFALYLIVAKPPRPNFHGR